MKWLSDNLPPLLALLTTLGFMVIVVLMMYHEVPASSHDFVQIMATALATAYGTIIGYNYGSSAGSAKKTEIMAATTTPTTKGTTT